jgi:6-phosphogluconolactonase
MHGAGWAAAQAAAELRTANLSTADGWPVLDLIVLGIGVDGHILSVFPGSTAFESTDWALAIPAPTHIGPHVERMTLNPAILGVARQILVVATGSAKAQVLATVFGTNRNPKRWPAQLARTASATWILDIAAAADLPS